MDFTPALRDVIWCLNLRIGKLSGWASPDLMNSLKAVSFLWLGTEEKLKRWEVMKI